MNSNIITIFTNKATETQTVEKLSLATWLENIRVKLFFPAGPSQEPILPNMTLNNLLFEFLGLSHFQI